MLKYLINKAMSQCNKLPVQHRWPLALQRSINIARLTGLVVTSMRLITSLWSTIIFLICVNLPAKIKNLAILANHYEIMNKRQVRQFCEIGHVCPNVGICPFPGTILTKLEENHVTPFNSSPHRTKWLPFWHTIFLNAFSWMKTI